MITLLIAYAGIGAVAVSQLGAGSVLSFPGLITQNLPSVSLISHPSGPTGPNPPGGHSNGNPGNQGGSGQYQGTHHLVSAVTPVKLRPLAAIAGAGRS